MFNNCTGLTSVTIGNTVKVIDYSAFYNCSALTDVIIPNSVTRIASYAFEDCSGLTSITIPNSVIRIGERAFNRCTSLKSVSIPNSVLYLGPGSFASCYALTDVYSHITDPAGLSYDGQIFYIIQEDIDFAARTLHVPENTALSYQLHSYWCPFFGRIVEDVMPSNQSGDVNGDNSVTISDVTALIDLLLNGETAPLSADCNQDGNISIADVTALIDYLLSGAWN